MYSDTIDEQVKAQAKVGPGRRGFLKNMNILFEKSYYDFALRFFNSSKSPSSQTRRDDKIACIIFSQMSLEAFINRIGIELVSKVSPKFDIEQSLRHDSFLDKVKIYSKQFSDIKISEACGFWQELVDLNTDRDTLVHIKPKTIDFTKMETQHQFLNDDILQKRFNVVKKTVQYLLFDMKIPHWPDRQNTMVYDYTDDSKRPIEGSMITVNVS